MSFSSAKSWAKIVLVILAFTSVVRQGQSSLAQDQAWQVRHVADLESSYAENVQDIDEGSFCDGDLTAALEQGIKFNEIQFIASHNSYKAPSTASMKRWYGTVSIVTRGKIVAASGNYDARPLNEQLDHGVRSFELDVEAQGNRSFVCMHLPIFDMTTYCYDFALAMKELRLWSDAHPNHLPLTVVIEVKTKMLPLERMIEFTPAVAKEFDSVLRETLGDKLFTPADMLRDYTSFAEMRAADDWCTVQEMLGKILVLLHPTNITNAYINSDTSLRSQAMFPMVELNSKNESYAGILMINWAGAVEDQQKTLFEKEHFVVRTRADSYGDVYASTREKALNCGAQILSTGYAMPGVQNGFSFPGGKTVRIFMSSDV